MIQRTRMNAIHINSFPISWPTTRLTADEVGQRDSRDGNNSAESTRRGVRSPGLKSGDEVELDRLEVSSSEDEELAESGTGEGSFRFLAIEARLVIEEEVESEPKVGVQIELHEGQFLLDRNQSARCA